MEKRDIIKYAASSILAGTLAYGGGLVLVESQTDHLNKYCLLNELFGLEHQVDKINHEYADEGYFAEYVEEHDTDINIDPTRFTKTEVLDASKGTRPDGTKFYSCPVGYTLSGTVCSRTVTEYSCPVDFELEKDNDNLVCTKTEHYPESIDIYKDGEYVRTISSPFKSR